MTFLNIEHAYVKKAEKIGVLPLHRAVYVKKAGKIDALPLLRARLC
ncbi:hypothetical protein MAHJHV51_47540 [Mycobacterium avium subsp. hominissuis]